MTTETNTLKDGTIITGFKNDLITNGLKASKNYYELAMLEFIRDNIPKGVMVDVGANIGNHTLFLAKYCATEVIAFEPFPDTCKLLESNILQNVIPVNVKAYCVALSNEQKFVKMKSVEGNAGMNKICDDGNITVSVCKFDDYYSGTEPLTLIKLDCEGYEEKALMGMIETIKKHQPALFIECQTEKELMAISKILLPLGYSNKQRFNATPTYYFDVR
jgi:FkbM family methyltransferase